jgi:hypothetical protein
MTTSEPPQGDQGYGSQPQGQGAPPPQPGPPPYGAPPPYGYGYPPYPPPRPTNGMSIAALILGIVGVCSPISILGLIFGLIARRQIAERGEGGDGFATAGIVLGWIGVASVVFWIIYFVAVFGFWMPWMVDQMPTDGPRWD